jgi:hypothetical protein
MAVAVTTAAEAAGITAVDMDAAVIAVVGTDAADMAAAATGVGEVIEP